MGEDRYIVALHFEAVMRHHTAVKLFKEGQFAYKGFYNYYVFKAFLQK